MKTLHASTLDELGVTITAHKDKPPYGGCRPTYLFSFFGNFTVLKLYLCDYGKTGVQVTRVVLDTTEVNVIIDEIDGFNKFFYKIREGIPSKFENETEAVGRWFL
jgi:hypothetical protein